MVKEAQVPFVPSVAVSSHPLPSDIIGSPPPGRARVIATVFIVAYLSYQVATPLAYYFSDDKFDERFAWRMFSATWAFKKSCVVAVSEDARSSSGSTTTIRNIDLNRIINPFWINLLTYNRAAVVDELLRTRCRVDPSVTEVHFYHRCGPEERSSIPLHRRLTCTTGAHSGTRGSP